jgi:tetratricopeptide (TPR) repeat protein
LDPSSAECWIGFGCSFAICDESDQALASFRAAQNKYSGSHIPLLYMGMEYLRTNHLSLASHFLLSAQKTDPGDPLCCNELGVWAYRRGDWEDAAFWFVKALRLHVEAESSLLTCADEALGANGYILLNSKMDNASLSGGDAGETVDEGAKTPFVKGGGNDDHPPPSTVLCALKTPSGQSIAAHKSYNAAADSILTDLECVNHCKDAFWEPTIYNLGQSYRKLQRYSDAIVCFEKCSSLNPVSSRFCFSRFTIVVSHVIFS